MIRRMPAARLAEPVEAAGISGDTPTLRLFALLEVIAAKDRSFSLQDLAEDTGTPATIRTVGMLERRNAQSIVVCLSLDTESKATAAYVTIPRANVRSVTELVPRET